MSDSSEPAAPLPYWAHPTAVVDEPATIGVGSKVWHYSHVMTGASVGARCSIGQNVFIASTAVVGDDCKLQNNVSVYDGVVLGDEVFVGPSAVFTNVDVPRAFINRKSSYLMTKVGRGATIGANATIVCGVELGPYAFVGAGAVVTKDVPAYALMLGVPARQVGWACWCGRRLRSATAEELVCDACGRQYRQHGGAIDPIDPID